MPLAKVARVAVFTLLPTVDAAGFLRDDFSDDGLHPNAKGYAVMAPLAEKAVAAALRGRQGRPPQNPTVTPPSSRRPGAPHRGWAGAGVDYARTETVTVNSEVSMRIRSEGQRHEEGMTCTPLTESELDAMRNRAVRVHDFDADELLHREDVPRLVAEVRRLRDLIVQVYPYVPVRDGTSELVAQLKAEVDRV